MPTFNWLRNSTARLVRGLDREIICIFLRGSGAFIILGRAFLRVCLTFSAELPFSACNFSPLAFLAWECHLSSFSRQLSVKAALAV